MWTLCDAYHKDLILIISGNATFFSFQSIFEGALREIKIMKNILLFPFLRTFAPKNFPHTDFFKTLTAGRK